MGVTYTQEQQKVIDLRDSNILVSAAAGSGKTAVLVERIITRLTQDVPPLHVDELLVVTFTEAAAAEMKERIRDAIEKKLEKDPENLHLQRQATLIHSAQITTIHSFCLSVIREHFHEIDLEPGFRIGEDGELKLLKHDVVEELLENYYEEGKQEFLDFVECYAPGKNDRNIESLILELYEFTRGYTNPTTWLNTCVEHYHVQSQEELEQAPFVKHIMKYALHMIKDQLDKIDFLLTVCDDDYGPAAYKSALISDYYMLEKLSACETFAQLQANISQVQWEKLGRKDANVDDDLADQVKKGRSGIKKTIDSLAEQYFQQNPETVWRTLLAAKSNMEVLCQLVVDFEHAFAQKKRKKNLIDFNDMEHMALHILTHEEDGELYPTAVAKEYQERFREIMIDEYQDSNLIQEAILTSVSRTSRGEHNVFMVGDVKQSIYRFRLSRPELFMGKYNTYSLEGGDKQRIDLHKNFRSREEVLESTNFIFEQIMTAGFGGIEYDENAALYAGADYPPTDDSQTEVLVLDEKEIGFGSAREWEVRMVAVKIKEMLATQTVTDSKTKQKRNLTYGDIVILTRSLVGWSELYANVFREQGIPFVAELQTGYFETAEITTLLDYLHILDNPRQDIPLTAVLTSCFVNLTTQELAQIKSEAQKNTFYECVSEYAKEGANAAIRRKLSNFLEQVDFFREQVPYMAIHDLLQLIIKETGYADYVAASPAGAQQLANVEMLLQKALAFEATSYKGLFHFIRYIEQLKKYNVDYGVASLSSEHQDSVRLMSIHKSKGLEFPVVIVAGMGKRFNKMDAAGSVIYHPEQGIGIDAIDYEKRTKESTLIKKVVQRELNLDAIAEELRILYVAMTRAKEKLVMTGTVGNLKDMLQDCEELGMRYEIPLDYARLTSANSYFDWIIPALYRSKSMEDILASFDLKVPFTTPPYKKKNHIMVQQMDLYEILQKETLEMLEEEFNREALTAYCAKVPRNAAFKQQLEEQMAYRYPYDWVKNLNQTMSVSEVKKRAYLEEEDVKFLYEEETVIPLLPKFVREAEETLTGASRGSAYHRLLELLDFSAEYDADKLKRQMEAYVESEHMTDEEVNSIRVSDILRFFESSVSQRMKAASACEKLYAEQPFVLGVNADEIYPGVQGDEMILVRGIIDVYFEEDGELVVLDYKTDRVSEGAELVQRYHAQLDYYAKALEQLTGKRVKEKIIYSFTLQQEIEV